MNIEEDAILGALESIGLPCKRRESGWVVPASAQRVREIALTPEEGALRIEAVLSSWDAIGSKEEEAIHRFLNRAQAGLRVARCEPGDRQAVIAANVSANDIEIGLPHAVAAVLAAVRFLCREVGALMDADVAEAYLRFFAQENEIRGQAERI